MPPTEYELSMAVTWTVLNAIRMFHKVPLCDVTVAEEAFLQKWRTIPSERRQAALEREFPVETEAEREDRERGARAVKIKEALNR